MSNQCLYLLLDLQLQKLMCVNLFCRHKNNRLPAARLVEPEATYLLWVDFRAFGLPPEEVSERIMRRARVRLENGTAFGPGGAGFFRVNAACPRAMLVEAWERIAVALGSNR